MPQAAGPLVFDRDRPRRGVLLTIYLLIGMAANAWGTYEYLFNENRLRELALEALQRGLVHALPPAWCYAFAGFSCLAGLLACIAIWDLLKPGVVLAMLLWIMSQALPLAVPALRANVPVWVTCLGNLGPLILLVLVIPKWKHMRWLPRSSDDQRS
jgi:hypothetical protein